MAIKTFYDGSTVNGDWTVRDADGNVKGYVDLNKVNPYSVGLDSSGDVNDGLTWGGKSIFDKD